MANLIFGDFFMKKLILGLITIGLLSSTVYAKKVEQTICWSKEPLGDKYWQASLGDNVKLHGGKCQKKTLLEMNKKGWRVIQVVGGLRNAFGMIMEK
jgi:hypothetical protein